jgi:hypothetical protein
MQIARLWDLQYVYTINSSIGLPYIITIMHEPKHPVKVKGGMAPMEWHVNGIYINANFGTFFSRQF